MTNLNFNRCYKRFFFFILISYFQSLNKTSKSLQWIKMYNFVVVVVVIWWARSFVRSFRYESIAFTLWTSLFSNEEYFYPFFEEFLKWFDWQLTTLSSWVDSYSFVHFILVWIIFVPFKCRVEKQKRTKWNVKTFLLSVFFFFLQQCRVCKFM